MAEEPTLFGLLRVQKHAEEEKNSYARREFRVINTRVIPTFNDNIQNIQGGMSPKFDMNNQSALNKMLYFTMHH